MKRFAAITIGVVLALFGLLWFLQGADILHLRPILCFASCEPITGGSLLWLTAGIIVFILGITISLFSIKGRIFPRK